MKAPAFVVNISSEAACGYPLRNHCNTLSLSTTTQTHAHTWMQIYLNATHTRTCCNEKEDRGRKKKAKRRKTSKKEAERWMNVGVCVDCSCPHPRTEFTHTHKHTYTRTHLPFSLTLPHPSPFSSPSLLLSSLPLSVGYIPPPFSLAHCCSQHTPYCSHFSVFLFSLSLFPFLILALSLPHCVTFPTASPRLAHTQTEAYCCLLFYNVPGPPDHSHLARSCVHNFKNNTWNEEIINLIPLE